MVGLINCFCVVHLFVPSILQSRKCFSHCFAYDAPTIWNEFPDYFLCCLSYTLQSKSKILPVLQSLSILLYFILVFPWYLTCFMSYDICVLDKWICCALKSTVHRDNTIMSRLFFIHLFQIIFLLSLTVNYHKIKMSKELTEYRDAVDLEVETSTIMESGKFSEGYSTGAYPNYTST